MKIQRAVAEFDCPHCGRGTAAQMWYKDNYHLEICCPGCSKSYLVYPILPYIRVKLTDFNGNEYEQKEGE